MKRRKHANRSRILCKPPSLEVCKTGVVGLYVPDGTLACRVLPWQCDSFSWNCLLAITAGFVGDSGGKIWRDRQTGGRGISCLFTFMQHVSFRSFLCMCVLRPASTCSNIRFVLSCELWRRHVLQCIYCVTFDVALDQRITAGSFELSPELVHDAVQMPRCLCSYQDMPQTACHEPFALQYLSETVHS